MDDICATTAKPPLSARSIYKSFGAKKVLAGVDIDVQAGGITGLIGPNGVGKTTLFRILAGITEADAGAIWVGGEDISKNPEGAHHRIGFVPEEPSLMDYLTSHEALMLAGSLHGLSARTLRQTVGTLLSLWDLSRQEHELIRTLSHGMKQKVLISMVLLPSHPILLLDEPLSGLDLYSCAVLKEILRLQARAGRCILASSHDLSLVEDVCDTVLILHRAEIVFRGPVSTFRGTGPDLESFVLRQVRDVVDPKERAARIQEALAATGPGA